MTYLTLHQPVGNLLRFYGPSSGLHHTSTDEETYKWTPSVDISETQEGFEIQAELPGVTKDDLHVSVKDNILTLSGEKRQEKVDDAQNYRRIERHYGSFQRKFRLPREVETDNIKAEYSDGVLMLSIPKPEAAKPTVIPVATGA